MHKGLSEASFADEVSHSASFGSLDNDAPAKAGTKHLVGTRTESWEKAAAAAIERASKTLRDLRIAEVVEQDLVIDKGKVEAYRTKLKVSFKYEGKD